MCLKQNHDHGADTRSVFEQKRLKITRLRKSKCSNPGSFVSGRADAKVHVKVFPSRCGSPSPRLAAGAERIHMHAYLAAAREPVAAAAAE